MFPESGPTVEVQWTSEVAAVGWLFFTAYAEANSRRTYLE